ncbi:TYRO protein tyrosine kinase-binding protein [Hyla sarda]|uniref:TYRO protein tyrosine kinase-binding protein n=1 Tax=Hyla sarda TaxID=327740 RepID=UPI0024C4596A|nr:TYRO protein tyrosine kinase-binding protein [Hyla sarda]
MKTEKMFVISHEDGTTTYLSDISFVPSIEDDQLLLTCTVTFENNVTTSSSISLSVKDAPCKDVPMPACRSLDSNVIAGMVAGNVVILVLIILGTCCFLKRHVEKRPPGNQSQSQDSRKQRTESTYQGLIGQKNDIYYSIRTQ